MIYDLPPFPDGQPDRLTDTRLGTGVPPPFRGAGTA